MDYKKEMNNDDKYEFINMFLEVLGGDKNSPIPFKILNIEKKLHDKTFKTLAKVKKDEDIFGENSILLPLLSYYEQGYKLLEDIEKKMGGKK